MIHGTETECTSKTKIVLMGPCLAQIMEPRIWSKCLGLCITKRSLFSLPKPSEQSWSRNSWDHPTHPAAVFIGLSTQHNLMCWLFPFPVSLLFGRSTVEWSQSMYKHIYNLGSVLLAQLTANRQLFVTTGPISSKHPSDVSPSVSRLGLLAFFH